MISQVILSIVLSVAIFFLAFNLEVEKMGLASNLSALMIVVGGTLAATLVAYPWKKLIWTARLLKKAFSSWNDIEWTIDAIVTMASTYRKSGMRALEEVGEEIPSGALKTAVELITLNYPRDEIERILEKEARITYSQYETAHKILYNMARLAPALGLAGTIISLIRIFGHITDSQSMVGYMAIALLNTFYGVVLANLCFAPLSNKLREFMDQEQIRIDLILEGILDVYDLENPRAIEYKLESLSMVDSKRSLVRPRSKVVVVPPKSQATSASL